jgi:hypothetical protein
MQLFKVLLDLLLGPVNKFSKFGFLAVECALIVHYVILRKFKFIAKLVNAGISELCEGFLYALHFMVLVHTS